MKKLILSLSLCFLSLVAKSQNASVEKSTYGIQTGLLGIWGYNETKLTNQFVLRSELGFDAGLFGGSDYDVIGYLMIPVLSIEPRKYFNLDERVSKSQNIAGNSGNFLSVKVSFHPDWFVISNKKILSVYNQISIIPTFGIRRSFGKYLNYETGLGVGYQYVFKKSAGYSENEGAVAVNLHIRIGFRF